MSAASKTSLVCRLSAAIRYFRANGLTAEAWQDFDYRLLCTALAHGDLSWPRRLSAWVRGQHVLDIGCGRNFQGYGFLALGAQSYTGLDPTLDLDDDQVKNSRSSWGKFVSMGLTPRQLMQRYHRLHYAQQTVEDFAPEQLFDVIVMHNVTEHLMQIDEVFAQLPHFLRPEGKIIFRHPNYYCWHGHHCRPRTLAEIDPQDEKQKHVIDWAHVRFDPAQHEWIGRTQNRIRLDELRRLVSQHFHIEVWEETPSTEKEGRARLTPEILAKYPEFTERELSTRAAFIVARKR
jgi:SAM-dependent methyltransferase